MFIRTTKRNPEQIERMQKRAKILEDLQKIKDPKKRLEEYHRIFGTDEEFVKKNKRRINRECKECNAAINKDPVAKAFWESKAKEQKIQKTA